MTKKTAERGMREATTLLPNDYVLEHLDDQRHALEVWASYSGVELP